MIRRHIDLIAIALLLAGIALYTHVRNCLVFEVHRTAITGFTIQSPPHHGPFGPPSATLRITRD